MLPFNQLLEQMQNNQTEPKINLGKYQLTKSCWTSFTDILAKNTSIKHLEANFNLMDPEICGHLGNSLQCNSSITTLCLDNNKIDENGAKNLSLGLAHNRTITTLNIGGNKIQDPGVKYLVESLSLNHSLKCLSLNNTQITALGAQTIANLLAQNCSIEILQLGVNDLGAEGITHISQALHNNHTLRELYLEYCKMGDKGACSLGEALAYNQKLSLLSIIINQISDKGVSALAQGLAHNRAMEDLRIGGNNISKEGFKILSEALAHNRSMYWLDLNSFIGGDLENRKDSEIMTSLYNTLKRNTPAAKKQERTSLVMGLHAKLGAHSPLLSFYKDPLFDRNLIRLIFDFNGSSDKFFVDGNQVDNTQNGTPMEISEKSTFSTAYDMQRKADGKKRKESPSDAINDLPSGSNSTSGPTSNSKEPATKKTRFT